MGIKEFSCSIFGRKGLLMNRQVISEWEEPSTILENGIDECYLGRGLSIDKDEVEDVEKWMNGKNYSCDAMTDSQYIDTIMPFDYAKH